MHCSLRLIVQTLVFSSTRDRSSERMNYLGEKWPVISTESCDLHAYTFGFFYMPQICDMGQTVLLPFRRNSYWGFFSPWKIRRLRPGLNTRTCTIEQTLTNIFGYKVSSQHVKLMFNCLKTFIFQCEPTKSSLTLDGAGCSGLMTSSLWWLVSFSF